MTKRLSRADHLLEASGPSRKFLMRIWPVTIIVLIFGILAGGWYLLPNKRNALPPPVRLAPAVTVTTTTPQRTIWPVTLSASGSIMPWQEAIVSTQLGGYQLVDVRVNVGDQVHRGQVLAQFDPDLLRTEEVQLMANAEEAEVNQLRAQALQLEDAISDQDVLRFVTAAKVAAAQLASKQLQLRYTAVVAPDDGVISARTATLGAVVPAGQELFRLIRGGRLEWRGELTAVQLAGIVEGQQVSLVLPDGSTATATVRDTAPTLDSGTRLGLVYADLVPGSRARAGMYVGGQIEVSQTAALVIPSESVIIRDGRSYVVTLADRSATPRVALQPVSTGRRRGDEIEIVDGLAETETLVRAGAGFLSDGDIVRLTDVPAFPSGAALNEGLAP